MGITPITYDLIINVVQVYHAIASVQAVKNTPPLAPYKPSSYISFCVFLCPIGHKSQQFLDDELDNEH